MNISDFIFWSGRKYRIIDCQNTFLPHCIYVLRPSVEVHAYYRGQEICARRWATLVCTSRNKNMTTSDPLMSLRAWEQNGRADRTWSGARTRKSGMEKGLCFKRNTGQLVPIIFWPWELMPVFFSTTSNLHHEHLHTHCKLHHTWYYCIGKDSFRRRSCNESNKNTTLLRGMSNLVPTPERVQTLF